MVNYNNNILMLRDREVDGGMCEYQSLTFSLNVCEGEER